MQDRETTFAHVDQPAFEQMQIDHSISRVALFFVCFLTIGVFYFTLVNFSVAKLLPIQQIQQVTGVIQSLNPSSSRTPAAASGRPVGLGGSQIETSASASPSGSAAPSASASAAAGGTYTVQSGDNLSSIAAKYKTNATAIAQANNMQVNAPLQVGQTIKIPQTP